MRAKAALAFLAACLLWACAVPLAKAGHDPLGSGTTKLVLDKRFAAFLKQDSIKLSARGGAKRKRASFLLAVSGGALDPLAGKGEIDNEGVLVFKGKRRSVPLRAITVKTGHTPLVAKVGGSQLKLATSAKTSFRRAGFAATFKARKLRLTAKVITRLNKKLRPEVPFREGQLLGTLRATALPRLTAIEAGNAASLAFDPAFLAKLDSRFVSLNPISPAERQGATFTFPVIAGGLLSPAGTEGELRSGGAVEFLQLGAGQVFWQELWLDFAAHSASAEVDVEPAPAFPGKLGRAGVLGFGAAPVTADPGARTISASGVPLALSAAAAATFNEAFAQGGPPAFAAGEAIGAISFTAQGQ